MNRSLAALTAMTLASGPVAAQTDPAGAAGSWSWVDVEGHPGRRFRLFVPAAVGEGPAPLVVLLHGCTQDPDDLARGTRFNVAAAEHGVLVAYPEQAQAHNPQKCWNWFLPAHQDEGGESAVVAAVARQVMRDHRVDEDRVFVAGISAGGAMAQNAAVGHPGLFAAVGVHSGVPYASAGSVPEALGVMRGDDLALGGLVGAVARRLIEWPPPAVIAIHGEADSVVSPKNVAALYVQWSGVHGAGTARDDSLQAGGRTAVRTRHHTGGQVPVEVWRVLGLGHAWSGGSDAGTFADPAGPDASRLMLDFFLSHPRRPRT